MTAFSEMYKWVRFEVLREDDKEVLPESVIDLGLEYLITFDESFDTYSVSDNQGVKSTSPNLTTDDKRLLILKAAFNILEPQDSFSYETAVLKKFLEGTPGLQEQKENIKRKIQEFENGSDGIPIEADNEINAWWNEADRLKDTIDNAKLES